MKGLLLTFCSRPVKRRAVKTLQIITVERKEKSQDGWKPRWEHLKNLLIKDRVQKNKGVDFYEGNDVTIYRKIRVFF